MHFTFLPFLVTLLSLSLSVSSVLASDTIDALPTQSYPDHLAALAPTDLKTRRRLKQVTKQQLLERQAKSKYKRATRELIPRAPERSPLPATTVTVANGLLDDAVLPLPHALPFEMILFGTPRDCSNLQMSTNGFIRFGGGSNMRDNGRLPMKDVGDVVLFPYLDDLVLPEPNFAMKYTYTNKKVIFEWETRPFGVNSPSANVHFQLEYLVDTPNILYVHYLSDSNPAYLNGASAAIGVQSVSEEIAYQYSNRNRNPGNARLPASKTAFPGRTLIIDTALGAFEMMG